MNSDSMSARQRIILRALRGLVAFAFVLFGTLKLIGMQMMVDVFDHVGLGQWFRYATGIIEVGGAILLLSPRFVGPAALVLAATMIGAIISHLTVVPGSPAPAALLLALSLAIAWSYRGSTLALLGLTQPVSA
ncbi:DoxX family protein [Mesorhizobium sp. M0815]|uniref:DoxX family protein n=1 Tax=Mesorhizobium sp. M0815 TaxID=2957005 RepID=UPI00333DE925